jgi:hypothetical protein
MIKNTYDCLRIQFYDKTGKMAGLTCQMMHVVCRMEQGL